MYLVQTENGFSEDQARIIFYKILLGIKSCHEESIAHLDINFNNILLDSDFNPIITDFGLSKEMVFSKSKNEYENLAKYDKRTFDEDKSIRCLFKKFNS